jgi:hypothetical protein
MGREERMRAINERREKLMNRRKKLLFDLRKVRIALKILAEKAVEEEEEEDNEVESHLKIGTENEDSNNLSIFENVNRSFLLNVKINNKLDLYLLNDNNYNHYKKELVELDKKLNVFFY